MEEMKEILSLIKEYREYVKTIAEAIDELDDGLCVLQIRAMSYIEREKAKQREDRRSFEVESFFDSLYEICGIPRERSDK